MDKLADFSNRMNEWYHTVIQTAVEGFFIDDYDGNILDVNDAYCRMSGYSREELLKMNVQDIDIGFIEGLGSIYILNDALKKVGGMNIDARQRCKNGDIIDVAVSVKYLDVGLGLFFCFNRDVSEQKRAYRQLCESEDHYRSLVEIGAKIGEAIIMVQDTGSKIGLHTFCNNRWPKITGYTKKKLLEMSFYDLFSSKDYQKLIERFHQSSTRSTVSRPFELDILRKDGNSVPVEITGADTTYKGKPAKVIYIRDISQRKQAEYELIQARKKMSELTSRLQKTEEEERKRISYRIHDEVGQLLTALKIEMVGLSKNIPADHEPLVKKSENMIKMLDTTSHIIKCISAELRPRLLDELGLTAAIDWQAREFQKATGITCSFISKPDQIIGNKDVNIVFFRIFQELITNIFRHAQATLVDIKLEEKGNRLILKVQDNGKGISKEEITAPNSLGLLGIYEKASSVRGKFSIKGFKDKGTMALASIPLIKDINND